MTDMLRVWVENQPDGIGYDGTDDYLRAAGVPFEYSDGDPMIPWDVFMAARAAVAKVGHGTDNEGGVIPGVPSLVASVAGAMGGSADEQLQQIYSREGLRSLVDEPLDHILSRLDALRGVRRPNEL
jgi:hypothetical protein